MKKLKLDLDSIRVESFETSLPEPKQQDGTVYAYSDTCPRELQCGFGPTDTCTGGITGCCNTQAADQCTWHQELQCTSNPIAFPQDCSYGGQQNCPDATDNTCYASISACC